MMPANGQPLMAHLGEFRKRLVASAIAVGIGFAVCYAFSEELFEILAQPLKSNLAEGERLVFTNLPDMFFVYLKTAFVAGLLLSSPFIFYQIWMFIAPGLYRREKTLVLPFIFFSTLLFVGGGLFGYFVVFPFGFKFFLSFENEFLQALPSVKQYFSFSIKLLLAFGLVFELPVVLFFLARIGAVTPASLRKKRKYAILMCFIVGAVITPPDVITQFMMAVPLIVLYEVGIIAAMVAGKRKPVAAESPPAE
ncbi:MAG: twin-arginine translocase subunit TatC [Deltaproteobacteria bacterium HGW-Deltaproteobacteria-15]|nr:MAG: twin-arginine translocase subunit TatC [Deltaproteobacteria bacterium HGW-Deltaproteobacteria-15]